MGMMCADAGRPIVFSILGMITFLGSDIMREKQDALMRAKDKVDAVLTNYDISFVLTHAQGEYFFRQATCAEGTYFELKGERREINYVDFVNNVGYELDADEKTGESFPLDPIEAFKGLAFHTAGHLLFMHAAEDDMVRIGSEKVLGRDTTVYERTFTNGKMRFWVDNKYGLALKYEMTGSTPAKMYVTNFTVGGVSVDGMVNLDEYDIG